MPNLEVSLKDFESLFGKKLSRAELERTLEYVKGEIDALDGDALRIDCKETNRPDLWSTEGLVRELVARTGKEAGIKKYTVKESGVKVTIDANLRSVRPLIACAIIKGVTVTENLLLQLIQLQEKVGENYGRKRKEVGIGLYDFDKMKPPVHYKGFADTDIEFIPLEWKVPLRPTEILAQHDKGKAYKHLLANHKVYPIVIDAAKTVASMPPIINSEATGKVTPQTKNLFIEVTGWKWETVSTALEVMCMSLADRGGKIYSCELVFPEKSAPYPAKKIQSPQFLTKKMSFSKAMLLKKTGLSLKDAQLEKLLLNARYNVRMVKDTITVEYPSYRTDIMHPVDVIEDVLISVGFNNITPQKIEMSVVGSQRAEVTHADFIREGCVGLGLQEILTFNLTSKRIQSEQMLLTHEKDAFVEIANPVSNNFEILRKRLTPQLLDFLAKNKNQEYPQRVFEIGTVLELNAVADNGVTQSTHLAIATTHSNVNFNEIKSILVSLGKYAGVEVSVKKKAFPFLGENACEVIWNGKKGFLGELSKEVVDSFGLKKPVALCEIEL